MAVRRLAEVQPDHFDFTPENRQWVDRQIRKYPPGRQASAVMALLRRAQVQHGGWLPKPAIDRVAEILELPPIRVLEIATFYTMYNLAPVGKLFVQFCGTTPCVLRGADGIRKVLEERIGPQNHVTTDGTFSWLEVECLGACCNAPMVQINDDYYEDLTPENFATLLDDLAEGRAVRKGSQTGRLTSEPIGGLTSLATYYGPDGRTDTFQTNRRPDGAAVLAAANDDPAADAAEGLRPSTDDAAGERAAQDRAGGDLGHGGSKGQRDLGTARPAGSIEDTGTRTDDPVGTDQAESSAVHNPDAKGARERQGNPPPSPAGAKRRRAKSAPSEKPEG